jgi:hypothetical protein
MEEDGPEAIANAPASGVPVQSTETGSGAQAESGGCGDNIVPQDNVMHQDDGEGVWMDVDEVAKPPAKPVKRLLPDEQAEDLYTRWKSAIPTLVKPFLKYLNLTMGQKWETPPTNLTTDCLSDDCARTTHQLTGLLFGSR